MGCFAASIVAHASAPSPANSSRASFNLAWAYARFVSVTTLSVVAYARIPNIASCVVASASYPIPAQYGPCAASCSSYGDDKP
jgi:hypothetical protein